MFLCDKEATYRRQKNHPKLLRLVTEQIDALAREMGFGEPEIRTRDFRAHRSGDHIVAVITTRDD
jgi:hypothetical protein